MTSALIFNKFFFWEARAVGQGGGLGRLVVGLLPVFSWSTERKTEVVSSYFIP